MSSLAEIQQAFGDALRYQGDDSLCQVVSDHFSDSQRLQIYRNNFVIGVSDVLAATYPLAQALVGEECFAQLARHHVLSTPPQSGDITEYGEGFDEVVKHFPAVVEAAPYLGNMIQYEWHKDALMRAEPKPVATGQYPLAALSAIPEHQHAELVFHLLPDIVLLNFDYQVLTLEQAIINNQLDGLNIAQPEFAVLQKINNHTLEPHIVTSEVFQLLQAFQAQQMLADIDPTLLAHLNDVLALNIISGFSISGE